MTPERYQRIGEIFQAVLERSPEEREAFLNHACEGDESLRSEVQSLLAAHLKAADFIEAPAYEAATDLLVDEEPRLNAGQVIGTYRVVSFISRGGMGEVYLAQDRRLNRHVALKILPQDVAANKERLRRFVQEAKAAAATNHPNIAHIYEIGEHQGLNFIAMEFIDGQTLRQCIYSTRPDLRKLLRYLQQVAEGLSKAHALGIIHRDLKPDNIMIARDGYAKILDFGLAKLTEQQKAQILSDAEMSALTTALIPQRSVPGTVLGTIGYLSPEQAQGRVDAIDSRSDIFSFGCILFEAVTLHKPFEGTDVLDSLHKIVHASAPHLNDSNPSAPPALDRIVRRCLAKDPDKRYQSIKDVAIELDELCDELGSRPHANYTSGTPAPTRRFATETAENERAQPTSTKAYLMNHIRRHKWVTVGLTLLTLGAVVFGFYRYFESVSYTGATIDSIAVLPFESGDTNYEYLSDGLSESIINSLAQLPNLRVIPRSSAFRYKGRQNDPVTAGKELGVASVVTGRLIQRGDNLLVSVELTDVGANKQLWGDRYDRKQTYILSLQEDIARKISEQLRLNLSVPEEKQLGKRYTENTEAYQLYLRGRYYATKYTEEGFKKGIEYFSQAIALDPTYALAYDGLAYCYYGSWYIPGKEARTKGKAAVKKALELDPRLAEAHASLATIYTWFDYDWAAAENEFRLALNINPNYALAHAYYAGHLAARERFDEAIAEAKKAVDLEPLSAEFNTFLGLVYFYSRRYDEAEEQLNRTIEFEPNFWWAHTYLARIEEKKGRVPVAIARLESARHFEGASPEVLSALGRLYALAGKKDEAQKIISQLQDQATRRWVAGYDMAVIYAALGEKDQAFQFLEKEYAEGFWYLNFLKVDPELDSLHSDPRFSELLSRVGL